MQELNTENPTINSHTDDDFDLVNESISLVPRKDRNDSSIFILDENHTKPLHSRELKDYLLWGIPFTLIGGLFNTINPFLLSGLVEQYEHKHTGNSQVGKETNFGTNTLLILFAVSWTIVQLAYYGRDFKIKQLAKNEEDKMSIDIVKKVANLEYESYKVVMKEKSDCVAKDINGSIEKFWSNTFQSAQTALETFAAAGILFWFYDTFYWSIMLSLGIGETVIAVAARYFKHTQSQNNFQTAEGDANKYLVELIRNYKTLQYFNAEDSEIEKCKEKLLEAEKLHRDVSFWETAPALINSLFSGGVLLWMAHHTYTEAEKGELDISDFSFIIGYWLQLVNSLSYLGRSLYEIYEASKTYKKVNDVLNNQNYKEQKKDVGDPLSFNHINLDSHPTLIKFKNVTILNQQNKPIVKDLSFEIRAGEMAALVGNSGAGKSAIVNILQRHYSNFEGSVDINDRPIQDYSVNSLRDVFTVVPQEVELFSRNIVDNVRIAKPNSTNEEAIQALKDACFDSDILENKDNQKQSEETNLFDLSGGQKQRLILGRGMLKRTKIFFFDEVTSAQDNETQAKVMQKIQDLRDKESAAVLIVAHRLSTIRNANKIICLKKAEGEKYGTVDGIGTHDELKKCSDTYKTLLKAERCGYEKKARKNNDGPANSLESSTRSDEGPSQPKP